MSAPALFAGLLDDAALFPPGDAPMARAVPAHRAHLAGPHAGHLGVFVVAASRLDELERALAAEDGGGAPLALGVTVPDGPAGLEAALERAGRIEGARTAAVELAAGPGADPREAVGRAAAALAATLPAGVAGYVEVPRGTDPRPLLEAVAERGRRAKLRTGGTTAGAFPDEAELAAAVHAAVAGGTPFKCTAGLHNAVRHTDPETGFEHHGFLNVLAATGAALRGASVPELAGVLAERDGGVLAAAARAEEARAAAVRTAFTGFGTCSVTEPLADLAALGLLPGPAPTGEAPR
ncbi:hypothetical protein J0910_17460 [Nocardiopsis sp. CNT-189]|uniref:hypothetical protein n=1 Tax=Nocardiopsis oceanisediminis TaxID=2816862 RepID=UPI003B2D593A